MKQLKLFLAMLVLLVTSGAKAQTDVTNTYLTNADFSSLDGWTRIKSSSFSEGGNGLIGTYAVANNIKSTTDANHTAEMYCIGVQARWIPNFSYFQQTMENLPAGVYTISYDVQNTNGSTRTVTFKNQFYVEIAGVKTYDAATEWTASSPNWTSHSINFNLTETSNVILSLGYGLADPDPAIPNNNDNPNNIGSTATPHIYISNLKLMYTDPVAGLRPMLEAAKTEATSLLANAEYNNVTGDLRTTLQNLSTSNPTAETPEAYNAFYSEITAAINAFKAAKPLADNTATVAGASKDSPIETSFVINGTFDTNINGWTATGGCSSNKLDNKQPTPFSGTYWENWNGSPKVNKMYQVIENIPNGTYKLKIAAFVETLVADNSAPVQYVFANEDKVALTQGAPLFYEVFTFVNNNRMEIGFEQTQGISKWMGIDNVSLTYYGTEDVATELRAANIISRLQSSLTEKQAEATALLANTDYANVTGDERTNLQSLSTATPSEQTAAAYETLINQLVVAINAFKAAKALADNTAAVAGASKDNPVVTSFVVNGTFDTNINGWTQTGGFQNKATQSATHKNFVPYNTNNVFEGNFYENWNPSAKANKMYQVVENIPNGTYKLSIGGFVNVFATGNSSTNLIQYVYANSDKTPLTSSQATAYEVYTYVTDNRMEIGIEQVQAIANWMGIDNVSLTYFGATNVIADLTMGAGKIAWDEAVAQAHITLTTYSHVVDPSKTALENLLTASEPTTQEDYQTAADNINNARTAFILAAQAYDAAFVALSDEITYAGQLGVSTDDAQAVYNSTTSTAADFIAAIEPLKVLEYNTLVGEGTEYTQDVTSSYIALWTGNIGNANGQHWSGDNRSYFDRWSGSAAVFTLSQNVTLLAGDYLFMLAGRGASNVNAVTFTVGETTVSYTRKGDQGYGIDTAGKANFSAEGTYANNNNGRGWEWRYIVCSLTEETTLNVEMKLDLVGNSWGSFTDMRILAKPTAEMAKVALQNAIASAQTVIDGINPAVGTGVFMIPESAKTTLEAAKATAQGVYDDAAATITEIEAATTAMNEAVATFNATPLNAPAADGMYYMQLTDEGFGFKDNVITFTPRTDTSGAYNMGYNEPAGSAYNQAIMFEATEGVNEYYMYVVNAAGEKHYVCTGTNYGGYNEQLRTTTDVTKALALRVVRNGADINFVNTKTNTNVGSNGDKGFFTANNYSKYAVTDYQKITFPFTVKAEKYSTVIFPFLPTATDYEGVTFYTCESVSGTEVVLTEATELEADKPYIVKNNTSDQKNFTTDIVGRAYSQNLTSGLLTGLYTNATVPAGAYVLQTQGEKQCFYIVPEGGMTGVAFRAYLTYNGANAVNRFDFQGTDATGIHAVDALLNGEGAEAIYDASGARIAAPQKGLNIIKMSNGKTVKVMIK